MGRSGFMWWQSAAYRDRQDCTFPVAKLRVADLAQSRQKMQSPEMIIIIVVVMVDGGLWWY